jgi:hypothetical protein
MRPRNWPWAHQQAYPECRDCDITHIEDDIWPRTGLGLFSRHIQSAMRASDWPWVPLQAYPECRGGDITHMRGDMLHRTGLGLFSRHIQSAMPAQPTEGLAGPAYTVTVLAPASSRPTLQGTLASYLPDVPPSPFKGPLLPGWSESVVPGPAPGPVGGMGGGVLPPGPGAQWLRRIIPPSVGH